MKNKKVIKNNKIQFYLQTNLMRLDKRRLREDEPRTQVVEVWAPLQQRLITQNAFEKLYLMKRRPGYVAGIQWTFLPSIANTQKLSLKLP